LFHGKIDDRETEAIGCLLRLLSPALAAACDSVLGNSPTVTVISRVTPLRHSSMLALIPGLVLPTMRGNSFEFDTGLPSNLRMMSPVSTPPFRRGRLFDCIDESPRRSGKTERFGEFLGDFLDHDADSSATDAAELTQLALHLHRDVDGMANDSPMKPPVRL